MECETDVRALHWRILSSLPPPPPRRDATAPNSQKMDCSMYHSLVFPFSSPQPFSRSKRCISVKGVRKLKSGEVVLKGASFPRQINSMRKSSRSFSVQCSSFRKKAGSPGLPSFHTPPLVPSSLCHFLSVCHTPLPLPLPYSLLCGSRPCLTPLKLNS